MLSKDSTEPQASPLSSSAAEAPSLMNAQSPIEVASSGNGTVNDPAGTDNKPPGVGDLDPLSYLA